MYSNDHPNYFSVGSQDSLDMAEFERSVDKKPQVGGIGDEGRL